MDEKVQKQEGVLKRAGIGKLEMEETPLRLEKKVRMRVDTGKYIIGSETTEGNDICHVKWGAW